jgi:hypothetical protein
MSEYGIPYMGSKSGIALSICSFLPKATHFYDLFGGGFSITHCMLENRAKKYQHFHFNEIKPSTVDLIQRSIAGEFSYSVFKPPWISREEFFEKKEHDAYIRCIWSFGNNQTGYMFGEDIEPYKKSMHMAVVFSEFDDLAAAVLRFRKWPENVKTIKQRRHYLWQLIEHYRKTKIPKILHQFLSPKQLERLEQLRQLQQLQQLERLEQLQQLEGRFERLSLTAKDYREVEILPDSVVYCDIPYQGTADYGNTFSHKEFFDWATSRPFPVYVSEYEIKDPRMKLVYEVDKRVLLTQSGDSNKVKSERLYWNGVS